MPDIPKHPKAFVAMALAIAVTVAYAAGTFAVVSSPSAREGVMPMKPIASEKSDALRTDRTRIYNAASRQAHYLLGTVKPWSDDASLLLLTESKSGEHWIRPNTNTVAGLAFLYRFGTYDAGIVGVSRLELLSGNIVPMMRYLVATHKTGDRPTSDGKRWGDQWQSAHWAHMLGRGAWWIWEDLPADVRDGVRRVVAHEADRIVQGTPPAQVRNDTKSEENAWNSQILSVAVLLMPQDERRNTWEQAFARWALSSYLRPADEHARTVVDGKPVRDWYNGANIHNDYTLENHNIVHPDYMSAFGLTLSCSLDYVMTDRQPPAALQYNISGIYENLKWFLLPDGGFVYPSGQDWRLFRNPDWIRSHVLMAVFGRDPDAWALARRSLDTLEKMQARSDDGAIYQPGEYFFASTQHDIFYFLGLCWLSLNEVDELPMTARDRLGVRRLDSGKIILHRTPTAVHTVSWGARVMAQCVPHRMDRVVSPHMRSGVGYVRVAGQEKALPVSLHGADVRDAPDGFTADLVVNHGKVVRATLSFRSYADGRWVMREKLTALADLTTTEIATGLIGVLNNPAWIHECGQRVIGIDDEKIIIRSCAGKAIDRKAVSRVDIDSVLSITGEHPLNVCYVGAKHAERARVTDAFYANWIPGERTWQAGDAISEFEITVRCMPE